MKKTMWRKRASPKPPAGVATDPLSAFQLGVATMLDWTAMADLCADVEAMARAGIGEEGTSICMQAREYLEETMQRFHRIGRMGASGPALQVWAGLVDHYALQKKETKRRAM